MKRVSKRSRATRKNRAAPPERSGGASPETAKANLFSIGHSNRTIEDFVSLLKAHHVDCLVDVRTIPRSRHNPQFNTDELKESLSRADIKYVHRKQLGGLRHAAKDSMNKGWRNASFRGFADYMQTAEFGGAIEELVALANGSTCAVMCAEAVPWRCHRSLIADALAARGVKVDHIMSRTQVQPHAITPFARVQGRRITYPPTPSEELPFPASKGN